MKGEFVRACVDAGTRQFVLFFCLLACMLQLASLLVWFRRMGSCFFTIKFGVDIWFLGFRSLIRELVHQTMLLGSVVAHRVVPGIFPP